MKLAFHIGLHKTGTTWLQKLYFRAQPQLELISESARPWEDPLVSYLVAEPDRQFNPNRCRDLLDDKLRSEKRVSEDTVFVVSAERLSGHPWSGGYDRFRIAQRIGAAFPEARIFCVLRGQTRVIESGYRQLVAEGYLGGIEDLLDAKPWKGVAFDWSFYEYDMLVEKYRKIFGHQHVCFLPYEQMREDMDGFLKNLCDFLNVPYVDVSAKTQEIHRSLSKAGVCLIRSMNYMRRTELNPFPLLSLGEGFHKMVRRVANRLPSNGNFLSPELQQRIENHYRISNERLVSLLGAPFMRYL